MKDEMKDAFFKICNDARPAASWFVCLYAVEWFYGGPEEGGWFGTDVTLIASQEFRSEAAAEAAAAAVTETAAEMSKEAKAAYGRQCQSEMDWLEQRGLESGFLREPDGPRRWWVSVEAEPGSFETKGDRHYS